MKKLLCYQCFKEFPAHEVWFRCENPDAGSGGTRTGTCVIEEDKKTGEQGRHAFPLHGFNNAFSSFFRAPMSCRCDICDYESERRICPHCHWKLSVGQGELAEHIIAIVGNAGSGKSHYLTVLIERVIQGIIGLGFEASINFGDNDSETLYKLEYRDPLFKDNRAIEPTDVREREHRRLIIRLDIAGKPLTLVFYDVAGELLQNLGDEDDIITNATRYLWKSSGIIYLANPVDVREWDPFLDKGGRAEYVEVPTTLFGRIIRELRRHNRIGQTPKIKTPIAVCINQFDRFYDHKEQAKLHDDFFSPETTPIGKGSINGKKLDDESEEIQQFMQRAGGSALGLSQAAITNFANTRFFVASALGDSPLDEIIVNINPNRVEAPFFWVLSELGILKTS